MPTGHSASSSRRCWRHCVRALRCGCLQRPQCNLVLSLREGVLLDRRRFWLQAVPRWHSGGGYGRQQRLRMRQLPSRKNNAYPWIVVVRKLSRERDVHFRARRMLSLPLRSVQRRPDRNVVQDVFTGPEGKSGARNVHAMRRHELRQRWVVQSLP